MEADASRYHGKSPGEVAWAEPERQTRAVKEYLAALDADVQPNPDRKPPKLISPSDPCSAWTAKANKRVQFGYGLNYLIDIANAVILDVEATPARTISIIVASTTRTDMSAGSLPPSRDPHVRVRRDGGRRTQPGPRPGGRPCPRGSGWRPGQSGGVLSDVRLAASRTGPLRAAVCPPPRPPGKLGENRNLPVGNGRLGSG